MIEDGAIDEVKKLLEMNLSPSLPVMKAHGVPEVIRYLNSEITLTEAIQISQTNTRHYAKRQYTWFKHQFPNSQAVSCAEELYALPLD